MLLEPQIMGSDILKFRTSASAGSPIVTGQVHWMIEKAPQLVFSILGQELSHGVQRSRLQQHYPLQKHSTLQQLQQPVKQFGLDEFL